MSETSGLRSNGAAKRPAPITDPVRVLLVDSDVVGAALLGRAVDIDRELAVVGICREPRHIRANVLHCRPDVIAIRLDLDDPVCVQALRELVSIEAKPQVVVLGRGTEDPTQRESDAVRHKAKIRSVVEENFGIAAEVARVGRHPTGTRLH